ncbi:hypothetical protein COCC4DRAFT_78864 [Bipolaris maydis ATCC 48331]|uniref:C2H2-type domain-containing protein n=2 Tax=Cochliobolus heterostrophus TaxID=5016 RepID=M2T1T4_COCH5|nr:uncharacterized protein COCC4DRAFT_78864 [Bipolaris maydis ATCC 48331]EMD91575.1 hypothetical protein COCHEDRAFT_1214007 [Bipolaris maydis C5]KAH7559395.1 hypothetical protein BM1_04332 [Bipolaris maydis]ENI08667.1 hypothetical protein COCC4DRAFT_78864 [Bipolaris maydis ATCC 48331]KAJ5027260.1 hypothetical protein J3E73DRAFT_410050 [Bipolaris maydis]KAJ5058966.1 hypothetical protein J3E74DRAFT_455325 [Bipolaris maydis]
MSTNGYNLYNRPHQQSSAQQYASCQTAPASNNITESARQYQQPPPPPQAHQYMPYLTQSYTTQNSGSGATWNNGTYGATHEKRSRAAEVLHSNPSYTPSTTSGTTQPTFTTNTTTSSHPAHYASSNAPQALAQQSHCVHGQSQAHLQSVNNNRALPSLLTASMSHLHATQSMHNQQQQQRSASPAQPQYTNLQANNARTATMMATENQQYGSYGNQQIASAESSRGSQNHTPSYVSNYDTTPVPPAASSAPTVSMPDTYHTQGTTTVDPLAVYDPWPEYQRKQAARKAIEDAARAEEERVAAETRKIEEECRREEERESLPQPQPKSNASQSQKDQQPNIAEVAAAPPADENGSSDALEAEIRAMMAKMRELNGKDPSLLARIWEEERRAKPKSQAVQSKPTPPTAAAQSTQPAHASTPRPANLRENISHSEAANTNGSKPATSVVAHAEPVRRTQTLASRPVGNTVWPAEKKAHLAKAAAAYIDSQNTFRKIQPSRIISLLNDNPSYIQLCEQLEQMGFKLDRAAFAKCLLTAVPDLNSKPRQSLPQLPAPVQTPPVPPAVMKKDISASVAPSPQDTPASGPSTSGPPASAEPYTPFPNDDSPAVSPAHTPAPAPAHAPVAEMMPIKPELRKPANKEEAARKRNLSDLVDLTQLSEDEDTGPPPKRMDTGAMHTSELEGTTDGGKQLSTSITNGPPQSVIQQLPSLPNSLRYTTYVQPLDRNKALRRNTYNPATIARDVLIACGRHPSQRNLNQHLDQLRTSLPNVTMESDLSTIRWDLIDPGNPPPDYFKERVEDLTQDANEEDSGDDERPRPRSPSNAIGGESGAQVKVQALPEAINPFIKKRRGRRPRNSLPNTIEPVKQPAPMNSSDRPASGASGVGYSAFRSATQYNPDGTPIPKKKGRPVGWRKAIHGSAATQARTNSNKDTGLLNKHQPPQPSSMRNVRTDDAAIRIDSRSPSVVNRVFQSYKCKWLKCTAELHNMDTLKKHVFRVHRKETVGNILNCLWGDCSKDTHSHSFDLESNWRSHLQQVHFDPLLWELGDGPASGLSDSHDSDAYLSDAQGRQVTPRITVDPQRLEALSLSPPCLLSRGRGRPPKRTLEQEARDAHDRLVSLKMRIGGPGMDRGGATLVNDKRRRGLIDVDETEVEIVNVEE